MKIDGALEVDGTGAATAARAAEAAGFDGVWAIEAGHDPFVLLATAAGVTERIHLSTGIAVAFGRNPMTLATLANDLQLISGGRFTLGIGSQVKAHITRRYSMPWSHPAPRMRELILAVRAIWACWQGDGRLDFRGEFYTHTLMTPFFSPDPNPFGNPTIVLAAVGVHMAEVAGEVADGMLVHPLTSERYLREVGLPALGRGAAKGGKERSDLTVAMSGFVVTGADEETLAASARTARNQLAFYASTPAYRGVLELHGWGDLQPELNALARRGEWTTMGELVDDEMLETFAVVCPLDDVVERVLERWGGLVDRFSFYSWDGIPPERRAEVLAAFRTAQEARRAPR